MKSLILKFLFTLLLFLFSCTHSTKLKQEEEIDTFSIVETNTTNEEDDSIQSIIVQRKETFYDGNIFGGLKMGINESTYNQILKKYIKEYDNKIYIEKDGHVISFPLRTIIPQFYKNQLVELEITIDGNSAMNNLEPFFNDKYGETKYTEWEWNNLEIKLTKEYKREYLDYAGRHTGLYYDGGTKISKIPYYTQITYKDLQILRRKERDKKKNDSLKNIKEKEKQRILKEDNLRKSKNIKNVI